MHARTIALACLALSSSAHAQWAAPFEISASSGDVWAGGIAASGTTVHVVWGISPVHYLRSTDEGRTWSADSILVSTGEPHLTDCIAADGLNVYVVYLKNLRRYTDWCTGCDREAGDMYLKRSRDGGVTWDPEIRITTGAASFRYSLGVSGSRLDLTWMDYRGTTGEIYYIRSTDRGTTWNPELRLVAAVPGSIGLGRPELSSSGENVHVVWYDDRDGNPACATAPRCPEAYYKHSLDGGVTWGPEIRLTTDGTGFPRPEVTAVGTSTVIVNYNRSNATTGPLDSQWAQRSTDNGVTWGAPVRITPLPAQTDHGSLVAFGSTVLLAWHDNRDTTNQEIYFRMSRDEGATWDPEERVTMMAGTSAAPLLAATTGYAHVTWGDTASGPEAQWYSRRAFASASCGDGTVDAGEECDDGNAIDTDACTSACRTASCGDGFVQSGVETCDDGNAVDTDACASCMNATCGDGFVESGVEACDDANTIDTDACIACASATCGDGFVRAGVEACDDGNTADGDACSSTCALPSCGNGSVQAGEQCDDGNAIDTDACLSTCLNASCGDGFVQSGVEACDDGNAVDSDSCVACASARCGDGVVQSGVEACDDGNTVDGDGCSAACTTSSAADGGPDRIPIAMSAGCGCRTAAPGGSGLALALAIAIAISTRRRRRARGSESRSTTPERPTRPR